MLDKLAEWAMVTESLGARVRNLREGRGLSQDALGRLLDMTGQAVYYIESGRTQRLSPATARKMAEVFGVDEYYLLTGGQTDGEAPSVHAALRARNLTDEAIRSVLDYIRYLEARQLGETSSGEQEEDDGGDVAHGVGGH